MHIDVRMSVCPVLSDTQLAFGLGFSGVRKAGDSVARFLAEGLMLTEKTI